jgi:hypothetical protein
MAPSEFVPGMNDSSTNYKSILINLLLQSSLIYFKLIFLLKLYGMVDMM